eukprot:gnl/TRDRNA2_/TRDRNA2_189122_c0_seq1.p1 gnl/TRDRNA2_/TRDRNA2_189122_c0~~gnl/TRDRNA2_/TRDRNA2_189122_c0_seq1.p1  ORF type:complete len:653 (+),score=112.86 gnl/TRDRNA2_/TRDRNA2_189122_c0_seq1:86-2044(+)
MHGTLGILLAFATHAQIKELASKTYHATDKSIDSFKPRRAGAPIDSLSDRSLKSRPHRHNGLDSTMLGKAITLKTHHRTSCQQAAFHVRRGIAGDSASRSSCHGAQREPLLSASPPRSDDTLLRRSHESPVDESHRRKGPVTLVTLLLSAFMALCPPVLSKLGAAHAAVGTTADVSGSTMRTVQDLSAKWSRVAMRIDGTLSNFGADTPAGSEEERVAARRVVQEVWSSVEDHFFDARNTGFERKKWAQLREDALVQLKDGGLQRAYTLVRTMLASGVEDGFTRFLDPKEFAAIAQFDATGVGLNFITEDDFQAYVGGRTSRVKGSLRVVGVFPGSAVDGKGIVQGDEIVAVDEQSVLGKDEFEVLSTLLPAEDAKGTSPPKGTSPQKTAASPLTISLVRSEDGKELSLTVPRKLQRVDEQPELPTKTYDAAGVITGYTRLKNWDRDAERGLVAALDKLRMAGADRFVVDLRGNIGGSLEECVRAARLFLEPGEKVVETVIVNRGRGGDFYIRPKTAADVETARPFAPDRPSTERVRTFAADTSARYGRQEYPLTVLVDGLTASASEIFAGALHDNCRAVVVGEQTFGKALIQNVYALSDGSGLIVTNGRYRLPSGRNLDQDGITPDFRGTAIPSGEQARATIAACEMKRSS